jgi:FSR family fosmidomycin resistance protein-like MFS transporter
MSSPPLAASAALPAPRHDVATMSLVGLAHGTSHFHHLLLAPLFPVFIREFGLNYAQLGLLVSAFFLVSGLGQALAGFVVDKVGARPVLMLSLCLFVLASVAASMAQGWGGLLVASLLAGAGNASFHPVDFTILNKRVSLPRLGHAFSVHGISGNLGWALAPVLLIGVSQGTGQWRLAYAASAALGLVVLAVLWWGRAWVNDRDAMGAGAAHPVAAARPPAEHPMAFLKLPSVWLCFSFFFWSTAALSAIQGFASPALGQLYGLPASSTAFVVTGYMLCGAAGMVAGGFLVNRVVQLERTIGLAMSLSALFMLAVGTGALPASVAALVAALAGVGTGLAGPSRDMLIKRAAPPGATGRVYGTVYSGLDVGFAVAAPIFGALMDGHRPEWVFWGAALTLALGVVSAAVVGGRVKRQAG